MVKNLFLKICSLLAVVCLSFSARATHIFGGELLYTHLSGSTYQVSLVLYGDCQGNPGALSALYTGSPRITLYKNGAYQADLNLAGDAANGTEVTPLCPSQAGQSSCSNTANVIPGIRKFVYTGTTTLAAANWTLVFNGGNQPSINPGRSNNITNIVNPGSSTMYLEATLNNTQSDNSSPQYTSIPTPFFCMNVAQQYNQGAVDPDGDSLSFSLTPALVNGGPAVYINGYSATQPMSATTGSFSYNTINGQLSFTPNAVQRPLIVNKVEEYKNGVLVGTSMREMTFIILNNCNNNPPAGNINNGLNTGVLSGNVISICQGTPSVSFNINPTDPDGDTILLANTIVPNGAVINVLNNNTPHPTVSFTWNTAGVPAGNYTFYLTYKDNGCPLSAQQTQAYTIQVVSLPTLSAQVLFPTQCDHKALVKLTLANGLLPRSVQLLLGSNVVKTYLDSTGTITDSLAPGNYTAQLSYAGTQCINSQTFVIKDSGVYPHSPVISDMYYCRGDQSQPLIAVPYNGATVKWYDTSSNLLPAPPLPSTAVPGIYSWLVNQKYNVCESVKETVKVYVTERPTAEFSYPPSVCNQDTALITFTGSTTGGVIAWNWTWNNPQYISGSNGGPYNAHWDTTGVKAISLQVVENKCASFVTTHSLLVKPTPKASFSAHDICIYDSLQIQYNVAQPLPGTLYYWNFDLGASTDVNTGIGPHTVHWDNPGDKSVFLQTSLDGCYDSVRKTVKVFPQPVVHILNTPETVCYGDMIYLRTSVTGGSDFTYAWTPQERIFTDTKGGVFTHVMQPTTYTVSVSNEYHCGNMDSITYITVEPCCNFSYPTAFSPNGDGKNDHFSIITYGNDNKYELRIFDRWGRQMFVSFNQHDSWDGTHNGKPCEMGTYYYMFKARCMTGHVEEQKGEITLVR